jgi:hypothetical protein
VKVIPDGSGALGVNVTTAPSADTVPGTWVPSGMVTMTVVALTVLGSTGSEKVTEMVAVRAMLVAPADGELALTVGAVVSPLGPSPPQATSMEMAKGVSQRVRRYGIRGSGRIVGDGAGGPCPTRHEPRQRYRRCTRFQASRDRVR